VAFYAALFSVGLALLGGAYFKGAASRNPEIAEYQAAIKASEKLALEAEARAKETAARVVVEYRDRVKVIREREPAEIQLVESAKRETDPACMLPPSFIRLWNGEPAPGGEAGENPRGVDEGARPLADLPEQTRLARKAFDENLALVEGWQRMAHENGWEIVKSQ
jgi:hypothetical protein